jgi:hypothetical protein
MQADAYDGFNRLYDAVRRPGPVIEVACWAHARRYLLELARLNNVPIGIEAVARIDALFAIEREINGLPPAERRRVRQERSKPLVEALGIWLREQYPKVSPNGKTAKAIAYSLNGWTALCRFLDDGRLCMSNNAAERALRVVAMRHSLRTPFSSVCKHWKLVFNIRPTRATFPGEEGGDAFVAQVCGPDLVRSAGHDLFGGQDSILDEPANRVVAHTKQLGGFGHRQPLAVLLRRPVSPNPVHPAQRTDTMRGPGFSLTRRHPHPVQRRGDVFVRPSGCHASHDGEGVFGGAAAMLAGF